MRLATEMVAIFGTHCVPFSIRINQSKRKLRGNRNFLVKYPYLVYEKRFGYLGAGRLDTGVNMPHLYPYDGYLERNIRGTYEIPRDPDIYILLKFLARKSGMLDQ